MKAVVMLLVSLGLAPKTYAGGFTYYCTGKEAQAQFVTKGGKPIHSDVYLTITSENRSYRAIEVIQALGGLFVYQSADPHSDLMAVYQVGEEISLSVFRNGKEIEKDILCSMFP